MMLKAICDAEDPRLFELYRTRYNQEDLYVSYVRGSTLKNWYDGRFGSGRFWHLKVNRKPEDENTGLVGFQEVSIYT